MSKRVVNNTEVYSVKEIVKDFLNITNPSYVNEFIDFLVLNKIIDKHIFRYGYRVSYVYTISCCYDVILEGHYYTEPKSWQGNMLNGTLYFDEFAAKVLSRLFRLHKSKKKFKMDKDLDSIISTTAMDYVPKIKIN